MAVATYITSKYGMDNMQHNNWRRQRIAQAITAAKYSMTMAVETYSTSDNSSKVQYNNIQYNNDTTYRTSSNGSSEI